MRFALVAVCALVFCSSAYAQPSAPSPGHDGMAMPGTSAGPGAGSAMMSGMERMNQAMSAAPMTGDPDHDFMSMMIPHHQGAIDMAKTELQYGKDPKVRRLARGIIAAQEKEIAEMKRWLAGRR